VSSDLAAASSLSQTSKKYFAKSSSEIGSLLIWMRSRTNRKWGDVYRPIFDGFVCGSLEVVYWARMEAMKALVEPFPLVPATCMGLSMSNSEGYGIVSCASMSWASRAAHLISRFATPLEHLGYGLLIHAPARLAYRVDNGEIRLQRVQRRNRGLSPSAGACVALRCSYCVVAPFHGG
jgi:hypothetical protein